MSELLINTLVPAFDFKPLEMGFYQKMVFSRYAPPLAKAAKALREVFEMAQMNPNIHVEFTAAVENEGAGEQYIAHFSGDSPFNVLLLGSCQQMAVTPEENEAESVYITKNMLLDMFNEFVGEHFSKKLVSSNGEQSIEFVSFSTKLRGWLTMLDGNACKIACNVEIDNNEPVLNMSFEYPEPEGMISIALYAK